MDWLDDSDDKVAEADHADREWEKLSSDFTNAGYREGITAGKEGALQEGFDDGFATVGVPIGREVGNLRGLANTALAFFIAHPTSVTSISVTATTAPPPSSYDHIISELRAISQQLSHLRLTDVAPPDLEAIAHAKLHAEEQSTMGGARGAAAADVLEELEGLGETEGSKMDGLEAAMEAMSSVGEKKETLKGMEVVVRLRERLMSVLQQTPLNGFQ